MVFELPKRKHPFELATQLKIENFQASDEWLEKWKKRFVYFLLFFFTAFGITVFVIHL